MCGICGIVSLKEGIAPKPEAVRKMMGAISHRGPDSSGFYIDKEVAIGHTRLAIIAPESGAQPITNEDGSIWLSFNGEIFNYIELRDELIAKGHIFKTKSDTETIIHAWEEWGPDCQNRFNGQWAFALWDKKSKKIIFSRDRHGIRPLYYTVRPDKILFSSEIKAIFTDPSVERRIDGDGLAQIFTFWGPVAPRTVFEGIKELEPGHYTEITNGRITSKPYWSISFPENQESGKKFEEYAEELKELLVSSSKLRFERSDVPVGAYLSGGIDSSITSSIVSDYASAGLKTFSLQFEDNEFDEGNYQKEMSKALGTDHESITVTGREIGEVFPEVILHTERPVLRSAPAPLFMLSQLVRNSGYKVVVTGEGADEVLAGYDIFREAKVRRIIAENPDSPENEELVSRLYPWMKRTPGKAPAFARSFFSRDLDPDDPALSHRPRWNTSSAIKRILSEGMSAQMELSKTPEALIKMLPKNHLKWSDLARAQWFEYKTLLSGYILSAQGDRMLMGNSVEGRFPFLDYRLIDFADKLPADYKLSGLTEKYILKEAFKDRIPDTILNRPKQPYRAPDAASFFGGHKLDWLEEITDEKLIEEAGIFNPAAVKKLTTKCAGKKGNNLNNSDNMMVTAVLSTMLTYKSMIKNPQPEKKPPQPETIIDCSKQG